MLEVWQPLLLQSPDVVVVAIFWVSGHLLTSTVAGKEIADWVQKAPLLFVTTVIFLLVLSVMVTVAPDAPVVPEADV